MTVFVTSDAQNGAPFIRGMVSKTVIVKGRKEEKEKGKTKQSYIKKGRCDDVIRSSKVKTWSEDVTIEIGDAIPWQID